MRRQRGGVIQYFIRRIRSPEDVEAAIYNALNSGIRRLPIPMQTRGYCGTDAVVTILFYADGIRSGLWKFVFEKLVRPSPEGFRLYVSDDYLEQERAPIPEGATRDSRIATRVNILLMAGAARVLRILDNPLTTLTQRSERPGRHLSFDESAETHGTAPGELCALLAVGIGDESIGVQKGGPDALNYITEDRAYQNIQWAFRRGNIKPVFDYSLRFAPSGNTLVAVTIPLADAVSLENPTISITESDLRNVLVGHTIALIRVNRKWYVSDDNVGYLLLLKKPGDPPEESSVRQSDIQYTFVEIVQEFVPERDDMIGITYNLRSVADWSVVVASTDSIIVRETRPFLMREISGLYPPPEMVARRAPRAPRPPPRPRAPAPAGAAAAGAGEPDDPGAIAELLAEEARPMSVLEYVESLPLQSELMFREVEGPPFTPALVPPPPIGPEEYARLFRSMALKYRRLYITIPGPVTGGRRYSRRVRQWGSRKGVGSSTRRRGLRGRRQ